MDTIDNQIFDILQKQGYQSGRRLALKLGANPRTIQRHIQRMREKGIFRVIAIPNFVALGYRAWASIGIKTDPALLSRVASILVNNQDIYLVAYSLGIYDLIISVAYKTISELNYFIYSNLKQIQGINRVETLLLIRPIKYYRYYWPGKIHESPKINIDYDNNEYQSLEIDTKIIDVLRYDGLVRPSILQKELGIPKNTIRKRIKFLRDANYFSLEIIPNQVILKDETWATIGINTKFLFNDEMLDIIVNDPNVYLVSACLGRFDLLIAARFNNVDLLYQFIKNKIVSINGIDALQTFLHNKPIKYHGCKFFDI